MEAEQPKRYEIHYTPGLNRDIFGAKINNTALRSYLNLSNDQLGGIAFGLTFFDEEPFTNIEIISPDGTSVLKNIDTNRDIQHQFPGSHQLKWMNLTPLPIDMLKMYGIVGNKRYVLVVKHPIDMVFVGWYFDNLEFLQGVLTACQWKNQTYQNCREHFKLYDLGTERELDF